MLEDLLIYVIFYENLLIYLELGGFLFIISTDCYILCYLIYLKFISVLLFNYIGYWIPFFPLFVLDLKSDFRNFFTACFKPLQYFFHTTVFCAVLWSQPHSLFHLYYVCNFTVIICTKPKQQCHARCIVDCVCAKHHMHLERIINIHLLHKLI